MSATFKKHLIEFMKQLGKNQFKWTLAGTELADSYITVDHLSYLVSFQAHVPYEMQVMWSVKNRLPVNSCRKFQKSKKVVFQMARARVCSLSDCLWMFWNKREIWSFQCFNRGPIFDFCNLFVLMNVIRIFRSCAVSVYVAVQKKSTVYDKSWKN